MAQTQPSPKLGLVLLQLGPPSASEGKGKANYRAFRKSSLGKAESPNNFFNKQVQEKRSADPREASHNVQFSAHALEPADAATLEHAMTSLTIPSVSLHFSADGLTGVFLAVCLRAVRCWIFCLAASRRLRPPDTVDYSGAHSGSAEAVPPAHAALRCIH